MEFVTPEEMREAERRASLSGLDEATLMENAGAAVARVVRERCPTSKPRQLLVVCGLGNNGGDGLVAARHMGDDWRVRVLLLGPAGSIKTGAAATNWRRLGASVETMEAPDEPSLLGCAGWFEWAGVILDSVLGTGVRGEVREPLASAIRMINGSGAMKVAVDVPSGLDPLRGKAASATVRADITVALHRAKVGLRGKGEYTGDLVVVPIGIRE
jgi:NAD(P)H-hydrate epimerase